MRLSEWVAEAAVPEAVSPRVLAVVEPVMSALGVLPEADVWVVWGDEPQVRWTVLAATPAGLVAVSARANVPQEGPRAAGKLTRGPRVQVGDLAIEMQGSHRVIATTVEGQVLRGVDEAADRIARFVAALYAAIDGR
ncbi:MAG: hypothetical protein WCH74_14815, partial [Chloroflexota bacterium]